jgi:hypothetical protein
MKRIEIEGYLEVCSSKQCKQYGMLIKQKWLNTTRHAPAAS